MKYFISMAVLILSIMLTACSGANQHITNNNYKAPAPPPESVLVFCDSMSAGQYNWPEQLQELAGVMVSKACTGGIWLSGYDLEYQAEENPPLPGGTYAVLDLGGNDIGGNTDRRMVQKQYSEALDYLYNFGYSPVCFTYPNSSPLPQAGELKLFNDFVIRLCAERGYPVIISSDLIADYIHYSPAGMEETALNAWRVLYPGNQNG